MVIFIKYQKLANRVDDLFFYTENKRVLRTKRATPAYLEFPRVFKSKKHARLLYFFAILLFKRL